MTREILVKATIDKRCCRLREKEIFTGGHFVCHEELQIECRLRSPFQELFSRVDAKNIRGSHMPSVFRVTNLKNNH